MLDFCHEGASLGALGVEQCLLDYCQAHGIDPTAVIIKKWPNPVEQIPFTRENTNSKQISHFFWMCKNYWVPPIPMKSTAQRMAFFMGRKTVVRGVIMHDIFRHWRKYFLLSVMHSTVPHPWMSLSNGVNLENINEWVDNDQIAIFKNWWQSCPISSIDDHAVNDQYDHNHNTNRDLLQHYGNFCIELVAETYTCGDAFFPTEKTIRTFVAQRPMIVYGPRYFLIRLREMGFMTWNDLWDESYDLLSGVDRWRAMKCVIAHLVDLDQTSFDKIVARAQKICQHNRIQLQQVIEQCGPR